MSDSIEARELKDRINRACRWYQSNSEAITALLPLRVPTGDNSFSLYPANWDPTYWIQRWDEKRLSVHDAEKMILKQLRPLFPILQRSLLTAVSTPSTQN